MEKFRVLRADEVDARVGTCNEKGFSLLLYKDARCDQNILDETVGPANWQRRHYDVKGNMFCSVGIYDAEKKEWIWKDDCGTESNTEKEKGEASDSFKRACFNWGIGRELYTAPFIYIKGNIEQRNNRFVPTFRNFKVLVLESKDGKISKLQISGDGNVIYEFGMKSGKAEEKPQSTKPIEEEAYEYCWEQGRHIGTPLKETPENYLEWYVREGKNERIKKMCQVILGDSAINTEDGLPF